MISLFRGESLDLAKEIVRNHGNCDPQWSIDPYNARYHLHATIAAKVDTENAKDAVQQTIRLAQNTGRPGPEKVLLQKAQVQMGKKRDAAGNNVTDPTTGNAVEEPISINILLDDDEGNIVKEMKQTFVDHLPGGAEEMKKTHDRYYPRSGHITLISKNRCPELFESPEKVASVVAALNSAVAGTYAETFAVSLLAEKFVFSIADETPEMGTPDCICKFENIPLVSSLLC